MLWCVGVVFFSVVYISPIFYFLFLFFVVFLFSVTYYYYYYFLFILEKRNKSFSSHRIEPRFDCKKKKKKEDK